MKHFALILAAAAIFCGAGASEFLIECETIPLAEGFSKGAMGSASNGNFLMMSKKGGEVSGKVNIPEAGDYFVWVRDYSMSGNFRKAAIFFNGKKVASLGDRKTPDGKGGVWMWNRAPLPVHLEAGELEIRLVSQSAYTRYDAMILSTDGEYKPEGKVTDVVELEFL